MYASLSWFVDDVHGGVKFITLYMIYPSFDAHRFMPHLNNCNIMSV